jgi:1,4-alpha-glucan branching enzyme
MEFAEKTIPRIVKAGYNTLQLMAIPEHPYYASFGYQVSSFFAPSSRFGTPEELKTLIDTAHGEGLSVLMDLIHSHAVPNEVEGLSRFDGTEYQYFHEGSRGFHPAWGSRCFDYGKPQVLHFLLSNCRYWLDEFRVDGFRFDGVTSMAYLHHGLGKDFTSYQDYFDASVDEDALTYLTLANTVIHEVNSRAVTIAEDVSGLPGLAAPIEAGGMGFDYRFAMGVPDLWIRLVKDVPDDVWSMGHLWHELNNRRVEEKTISYAESHDQALVGDQTLMFRLAGAAVYDHMRVEDAHLSVDRGMALHKMIRLITLATAGDGYLNFMGNEFGHPEWIDFPRQGNAWSFRYARRQWHLADDPNLKFHQLGAFDRQMIRLAKRFRLFGPPPTRQLKIHEAEKVMIFIRKDILFCFNFHPINSYYNYFIHAPNGEYQMVLDTDSPRYGGHGRLVADQVHITMAHGEGEGLRLYFPSRTAVVLHRRG